MNKFLLVFLFLPLFALSQEEKDFVITGFLKGLPDNTEVTLTNDELGPEGLASGKSSAGKFILKGKIAEPNLYYISYAGSGQKLYLFLDPSKVTISGHKDSLTAARVQGSATHTDFSMFNTTFNPLFMKLNPVVQHLNAGKPDPDGSVRKQYEQLVVEINNATDKYVDDHTSSYVAPLAIMVMSQLSPDISVTENRYLKLQPSVKEGYFGRIVSQTIEEGKFGAIGTEAIEFIQNDTTGQPVSLSSFRGKYVLIDFWASWCKPCRMENPNVVEAYKKYSPKNFTVLGVSLDRAREPWIKAIHDDQLYWTQVSDLKFWQNEVAAKYRIQSIPQNYLIDPNGKIIGKNLRGEALHQKLEEVLK